MVKSRSRYGDEQYVRQTIEERLGRQLAGSEWNPVWSVWVGLGVPVDDEEFDSAVDDALAALRPLKHRRREPRLYDGAERRRAETASRLRASDRDVKDAAEAIWSDVWGDPSPPFSDSSSANSWLMVKVFAYQHTGGGLGGGPLLSSVIPEAKLEYVGGLVDSLLVPRDSELGRLQQAADSISDRLNCFPHQAVEFLLTAEPPMVMPVTADLSKGRTTLHVNYPWVKPGSVRRFHAMIVNLRRRSAKRRLWVGLGTQQDDDAQRLAELGPQTRELLEFDASMDGLSSKERYIAWNRKYPGRHRSKESLEVSMSRARRRRDGPEPFAFDGIILSMYEQQGYIRLPH